MGYLFRFTGVPIVGIRPPAMRRQRERGRSDRAFVVIDGRRHKLGVWGSEAAQQRYQQLINPGQPAEAAPSQPPSGDRPARPTVNELMVGFMGHVLEAFAHNPVEVAHYRTALRVVKAECGRDAADEFGPRRLQRVRDRMVAKGWGRNYVNSEVNRVRRMFRWAVSEELIGVEVHQALQTVENLRRGRTPAPESPGVAPVADDLVDATLPHLNEMVRDMVQVQRLTGCRPGELCMMAAKHIDSSGEAWIYTPPKHKTQHHGKIRTVAIGPRGQAVLAPYVARGGRFFKYETSGYRQVIRRACKKAGLEVWKPNQLRHTAATKVRAEFGIEGAQHVLGHASANVTQVYAERNTEQAKAIAIRMG